MKIGINLVGIYKGNRNRNFNDTKESIKKNIINCWNIKPKIYITTYHSDEDDNLINFFKPEKYQFLNSNSDQRSAYIKSLEQLKNEDIDFIISTRFDIDFFDKISNLNIDFNKFNFLFKDEKWEKYNYVSDTFFCFPKKYLEPFINSLNIISNTHTSKRRRNPSFNQHMHNIYDYIDISKDNIHFIINGYHSSLLNNIYKLKRK